MFDGVPDRAGAGPGGLQQRQERRIRPQPDGDPAVDLLLVAFVAVLFTIFLGTVFPLLAEAVAGTKVSVGTPYFDWVTAPLFLAIVFLMGVGPLIAWRKASWNA